MNKTKSKIDSEFQVYIQALAKLVQIESVLGQPEKEAPFGNGPKEALVCVLDIAEEWGFEIHCCENAIGYAEWINDPKTADYVGVLGHVDVVPAGTGWNTDPFHLTLTEEKMYGRGVLDNKGPALASLFALKLLKDSGKTYKKNVRIIFGTNEESGSKDIPYYLKGHKPPLYGFTPDSQFPAVYGEKGVVSIKFLKSFDKPISIKSIQGEFVSSSVPDHAILLYNDGQSQEYSGLRAPSNEPQLGRNALTLLANKNKENESFTQNEKEFFQWISDIYHEKVYGEGLIGSGFSEYKIQITPYNLTMSNQAAVYELSLRYSVEKTEKEILEYISLTTPSDVSFEVTRSFPPIVFDRTHPMVQTMIAVYEEVTGMDGEPLITTGATYARFMPNIIAFGPSFPGQIGIAHNSNEWMEISDIKLNIEIYANVLEELIE